MPVDPFRIPDIGEDAGAWKTGGAGGGNPRFTPPGGGIGGGGSSGGGGGGGPLAFGYDYKTGFDPMGEQRRKLAMQFGKRPQNPLQSGHGIDPAMIQKLMAMLGGSF